MRPLNALERRTEPHDDPEFSARSAAELDAAGSGRGVRPAGSYAAAVIHYRAYADLKVCLESLAKQSLRPSCIFVMDVESDAAELPELREAHPEVRFEPIPNLGYAGGANAALLRVQETAPDVEFALILNPDLSLDRDFGARLVGAMREEPSAALGTGKLLRSDTGRIDSAGITLPRHRRPRDRGSDQEDTGRFDRREFVFGASGAALLLRMDALDDLAIEGEIFDADFFMYHEDTDLAWRAQLLGWRVLYEPAARGLHVRRWRQDQRARIEPWIRRHSFKNHYLQILKNERASSLLLNLPWLLGWEVARVLFALYKDRAVLSGYREAWRLAGSAWRKRRILQARARRRARTS